MVSSWVGVNDIQVAIYIQSFKYPVMLVWKEIVYPTGTFDRRTYVNNVFSCHFVMYALLLFSLLQWENPV